LVLLILSAVRCSKGNTKFEMNQNVLDKIVEVKQLLIQVFHV